MPSKVLWLSILLLALMVGAGNYFIARGGGSSYGCPAATERCQCVITSIRGPGIAGNPPTCSAKWSTFGGATTSSVGKCDSVTPGTFDRIVTCGPGISATFRCGDGTTFTATGGSQVKLACGEDSSGNPKVELDSGWTKKKKPFSDDSSESLKWVRRLTRRLWGAAGDNDRIFLSERLVLRVADGEAGFVPETGNDPTVYLGAGEATVEAVCSGVVAKLSSRGPLRPLNDTRALTMFTDPMSILQEPKCLVKNMAAKWRGAYAYQLKDKSMQGVPMVLEVDAEGSGTLQIPEGSLPITSYYFSSGGFRITASGQVGGVAREVRLNGSAGRWRMTIDSVTDTVGSDAAKTSRTGKGVADRLLIVQEALPAAVVAQSYSHQIIAVSPHPGKIQFSLADGALPDGMSLDADTGVLSGTPQDVKEFKFTVAAADANGDVFLRPLSLNVKRMFISSLTLPDGYVGQAYKTTLQAAGGAAPYRWRSYLPVPGVTIDADTGELTVAAASKGTSIAAIVTVTDAVGNTDTVALGANLRNVTIVSSYYLPEAVAGKPYSAKLEAVGGSGKVKWEMDETDCGLKLDPDTGELSGTPTAPIESILAVRAVDGNKQHDREFLFVATDANNSAVPASDTCRSCKSPKR